MGSRKEMTLMDYDSPFNSPLELGLRCVVILSEVFPDGLDLERLLIYDYLLIHSADVDGPPSVHPEIPLRTGELTVRRDILQKGLNLMTSRRLILRNPTSDGFSYSIDDSAGGFLNGLSSSYVSKLVKRAKWVVATFGNYSDLDLQERIRDVYNIETWQFQPYERPGRETT